MPFCLQSAYYILAIKIQTFLKLSFSFSSPPYKTNQITNILKKMRGGRCLKQGKTAVGVMEIEKQVENLAPNHENHVSGAYIRSLVRNLSSSSSPPPPSPPPQPRKKQARRRLHTTRPYQERLLNMAEARREIVTALKFHRAAKKQHKQEQEQEQEQPQRVEEKEKEKEKERLILPSPPPPPKLCSSWVNNFSNIAPTGFRSPCLFFPPPPPPPPPPLFQESFNFPLPNQTLGLNLNFQDFDHLDASPYLSSNNPSVYLSSSSSNYCSVSSGLHHHHHHHPSLDEREISEVKSMGEKQQMEWNDSMNLETSALWLEFLKTMEEEKRGEEDDCGCYYPFDEAMEFPVWLNNAAGDESCLEDNLNVNFSDDFCFQNPALPRIEEIQGNEVEWLTGED